MARISKANKYAIFWLNSQGVSVDQISKELKLTPKQITTTINSNIEQDKNETPSSPQPNKNVKDFIIRHSQNNVNNVSIMTQQASMMADENRKTLPQNASLFHIKKT